jgi:hypothetical protein
VVSARPTRSGRFTRPRPRRESECAPEGRYGALKLVPVMIRLVRTIARHADVLGLLSSIWAMTWLVNEELITNEGWPVAQPRFRRRPSARIMIERAALPGGEDPLVDWGLMLCFFDARHLREAGHVDLVVEVADVATIALSFIFRMWSAVMMSLLPVAVMKMSACSITSSSVTTS